MQSVLKDIFAKRLSSLKQSQLQHYCRNLGITSSTGTKAILSVRIASAIYNALSRFRILEEGESKLERLGAKSACQKSTELNVPTGNASKFSDRPDPVIHHHVLSIDVGIRNLGVAYLIGNYGISRPIANDKRKSSSSSVPYKQTIHLHNRVNVAHWENLSLHSFNSSTQSNSELGATTSLDTASVSTPLEKQAPIQLSVLTHQVYNVIQQLEANIHSTIDSLKTSKSSSSAVNYHIIDIIIEKQRIRNFSPSPQNRTIYTIFLVNIIEALLHYGFWDLARKLNRDLTSNEHKKLIDMHVYSIGPKTVSDWVGLVKENGSGNNEKGINKTTEKSNENTTKISKRSLKKPKKSKKMASKALVQQLLNSPHSHFLSNDPNSISNLQCTLKEPTIYVSPVSYATFKGSKKQDDLADALVNGLSWMDWSRYHLMLGQELLLNSKSNMDEGKSKPTLNEKSKMRKSKKEASELNLTGWEKDVEIIRWKSVFDDFFNQRNSNKNGS
ncbi:hypothetical protein BKA69DRAFT_1065457 [Paraphysoderma sedebokerense]|nr:hypothetical protein BKA69DRAFT_1065457 [Paraphysoderma sedebokerense]